MTFPSWIIDAHSHLGIDTPAAQEAFLAAGIGVVNVCVDSEELGGLGRQRKCYHALRRQIPERFGWCTSFSLAGFGTKGWEEGVIGQLDHDFAAGACACKVWKNVGMELRDPDRAAGAGGAWSWTQDTGGPPVPQSELQAQAQSAGSFVLPDDPRLDAVYAHVAERGKPMLMHIAEPLACWRPLDPDSPHYGYYRDNPQWHFWNRADVPSHEQLMLARDRVMEKHPGLTVVGAHFGSMEYDYAEIARRMERYPNFFVDTSARLWDAALLTIKDRQGFRDFLIQYAERILWGVDIVLTRPASAVPVEKQYAITRRYLELCEREWRFYATGDRVKVGAHWAQKLELPEKVLKRIFRENAKRIYFRE